MGKYTTVFYNAEDLAVIDTQASETLPRLDSQLPHYTVEGEFDGVVDPTKGLEYSAETPEEELDRLRTENEQLRSDNDTNALALLDLATVLMGDGGGVA